MNEVLLSISGMQMQGEEQEKIELITKGTVQQENGAVVIAYEESDLPQDPCETTIRVHQDMVIMEKEDALEPQMVFEKDKLFTTFYQTPMGNVQLSVFTTMLKANLEKTAGKLELEYILDIQGEQILNRLKLEY